MNSTLDHQQRAAAKRVAKDIIGSPAPHWSDLGEDIQEEKYARFLEQLRKSRNSGTANVLEQDKGLALTLLQQKAKSMRSEEKRKAFKRDSKVYLNLSEATQLTSQHIKEEFPNAGKDDPPQTSDGIMKLLEDDPVGATGADEKTCGRVV